MACQKQKAKLSMQFVDLSLSLSPLILFSWPRKIRFQCNENSTEITVVVVVVATLADINTRPQKSKVTNCWPDNLCQILHANQQVRQKKNRMMVNVWANSQFACRSVRFVSQSVSLSVVAVVSWSVYQNCS